MFSKVVAVPSAFFEKSLPILNLWEVQVYLHIAYEAYWLFGKPHWTVLDRDQLWLKFGLDNFEIGLILKRLAKVPLIEFKQEQSKFYVRLCSATDI
jgi:hypothetical protein